MFDESVTEHYDDWADEAIIETVDASDETELRRLVELVERTLDMPGAVHLHVMGVEQWEQAQTALMARRHRNGAELHLQVLRDPRRPNQLFASPSMVAGLNEKPPSRTMLNQMIGAVIAGSGPRLSPLFARGASSLIGEHIQQNSHYNFYTGMWMLEAKFLSRLIGVLIEQYGFEPIDWLRALKQRPGKFHLALRRTGFWKHVIDQARHDPELAARLARSKHRAKDLSTMLTAPEVQVDSPLVQFIDSLIDPYLRERDQASLATASTGKGSA